MSVRNAAEAEAALAGGADIIDVKEPRNGPLGRADRQTLDQILATVGDRAPVSAAAGELVDLTRSSLRAWLPACGLQLVKCGLARSGAAWRNGWQDFVAAVGHTERCVPVVYADWQAAGAPPPDEVARVAQESGCRWLLIDTFNKSQKGLLQKMSLPELAERLEAWRALGLLVALAGRLSESDFVQLSPLMPAVLGVRGAACEADRDTPINAARVCRLRALLMGE